jgi:hypothetical protein
VHLVGILIVPYISSTVSGFGDFQWKSPFDNCPATSAPFSLTNLQVSVGGVNQLQSTLNHTFENFIEPINLAEALTSSYMSISCGLHFPDVNPAIMNSAKYIWVINKFELPS